MRDFDDFSFIYYTINHPEKLVLQGIAGFAVVPIYNTLESIRMMAKVNGDKNSAYMLFILGKLLRYGINTKKQIVTVSEEIEHLKHYITLQNHRFDDKFELVLDVEEELLDSRIIKLVFQPIVENAIYHALETIEGKGYITVRGYTEGQDAIFDIRDNGLGMEDRQLEALQRNINDFDVPHDGERGIGLKNINERIKLYFGKRYGLGITSKPGEGTIVSIRIPKS